MSYLYPPGALCLFLPVVHIYFMSRGTNSSSSISALPFSAPPPFMRCFRKQIGKECITCDEDDPTIKAGNILLSTADIGMVLHYKCAIKKRKDYTRVVFEAQDKRRAEYLAKDAGNSAEKKAKLEEANAAVPLSELAPDSDDEL